MNQAQECSRDPLPDHAPDATVLLVLRNVVQRDLLRFYLGARGWKVRIADVGSAVRQWSNGLRAPFIVLAVDDDDPDAFELLGALAARTIDASMIVCVDPALAGDITDAEARLLGIDRLLVGVSFVQIARTLDAMRAGWSTSDESPGEAR